MGSTRKTFEERASDIERQIAQLRERRREVLARESEADRKGESATRFAIGGLVLECFEGGWRTVDLGRMEEVVGRNRHVFASCVTDALAAEEAARRTRDWERSHRERLGARSGAEGGDGGE